MGATSVLAGLAGVRACVVVDGERRVVEQVGLAGDAERVVDAAAGLSAELAKIGVMLGLGPVAVATAKLRGSSWTLGCDGGFVLAAEVEGGHPAAAVEAALRGTSWSSLVEADVRDADIESVEDHPPAPRDGWTGEGPTRPRSAVVAARMHEAATAPPAPLSPARPGEASRLRWRKSPRYTPLLLRSPAAVETAPPEGPDSRSEAAPASGMRADGAPERSHSAARLVAASPRAFVGSLQALGFQDLVEFLRNGQRTGALLCTSAGGVGALYMRSGRLVSASSPGTRPLASYLVARGALTKEALRARGGELAWSSPLAASVVVKRGLAAAADVRVALSDQLREAVCELLAWEDGEFSFDSENTAFLATSDPELEFDAQAVLLEVLKSRDEAARAGT